jgi:hypothetical protein
MDDDKPYIIRTRTKITLSSLAKEMARMHGMSEVEMARHLCSRISCKSWNGAEGGRVLMVKYSRTPQIVYSDTVVGRTAERSNPLAAGFRACSPRTSSI